MGVTSVRATAALNVDSTIPALPVYLLDLFMQYFSYRQIQTLSCVSKGYYAWVKKGGAVITRLNASQNFIGGGNYSLLLMFKMLNELNFSYNSVGKDALKVLLTYTSLKTLDLSNNLRIFPRGVLCDFTQLNSLDLSCNYLWDKHLTDIIRLTNLKELKIAENRTSTAFHVGKLAALTSLTSLNLSKNYIGSNTGIFSLALSDLDLSYCVFHNRAPLERMTSLKRLNLSFTALSFEMVVLSSLTQLEHLNISNNSLGDRCLRALEIPDCIQELDIGSSHLFDDSISELLRLTNLRFIHLDENCFSRKGLELLSKKKELVIAPELRGMGAASKLQE